jgi:hypothetical protein
MTIQPMAFNWRNLLQQAPALGTLADDNLLVSARKVKKRRHVADPADEVVGPVIPNTFLEDLSSSSTAAPLPDNDLSSQISDQSDEDISLFDEDEAANECDNITDVDLEYIRGAVKPTFLTKGSKLLVHIIDFAQKQNLCPGSDLNYESLYQALALIRYVHSEDLSDTILASIVGLIAAALPPSHNGADNTLQDNLGTSPSIYRAVAPLNVPLYTMGRDYSAAAALIHVCHNGCTAYCGKNADKLHCDVCRHARYRTCSICNKPRNCNCKGVKRPFDVMFFLPIEYRIRHLLNGPLRALLYYNITRWTPPSARNKYWFTDIYDGTTWQWFENQMQDNERFIGLALCSDGIDIYNMSGKCTNPVQVSIMNLPPNMRNKLHVGLFLWAIDKGSDAALSVIVDELLKLWTVGIPVDDLVYRVGLVCVVLDGKGYEKVRKQQGGGSYAGCTDCDLGGRRFDGAMNICGHRR